MMDFKRGHIYWVNLNPTKGAEIKKLRPCVVLGVDSINRARKTVVVIPLFTSGKVNPPLAVLVNCNGKDAVAVVDQIRAVDKSRFSSKIGMLKRADIRAIEDGIRVVLDFNK